MDNSKQTDKRIGKRIADIRKGLTIHHVKVPLSQEALAAATGIQRSRLGRIERGNAPVSPHELTLICHHLKITPNDLFCPPPAERFKTETFVGKLVNLMLKRIL